MAAHSGSTETIGNPPVGGRSQGHVARHGARLALGIVPKFLLVFLPAFICLAGLGVFQLLRYDTRAETEALAARVGSQAARASLALERHGAVHEPALARDLLSPLNVDPAVECAGLQVAEGGPAQALPAALACPGGGAGTHLLALAVADTGYQLIVHFSEEGVTKAAAVRRNLGFAVVGLAVAVAVLCVWLGYHLVFGRRLTALRHALTLIADRGERRPVRPGASDEIGRIMASFNEMIDSEVRRERILQEALDERARVQQELEQVNGELEAWIRTGQSEQRFRDFVASASDWYWEMDDGLRFSYFSDRFTEVSGVPKEALLGKTRLQTGIPNVDEAAWLRHLDDLTNHCAFRNFEHPRAKDDGDVVWLSINGTPIFDDTGTFKGYRGTGSDITERVHAKAAVERAAHYDAVTGLPNRLLLGQHLQQAIDLAARHGRTLAVLFIDLDHFKRINDTWGHSTGDEVLREVSRRLARDLRPYDVSARRRTGDAVGQTVARLGGDEFVVLLPEIRAAEDAAIVAQRLSRALAEPLEVDSTTLYVTTSIGISLYPDDASTPDELLKQADAAMYQAKGKGRNGFSFYTQALQGRAYARLQMESGLRRALDEGEFLLHYQPKIDLRTGRVTGLEALVRWNDPFTGLVSPGEFIPVAEESGLIVPLGEWVLREACLVLEAWRDTPLGGLRMAVNVSAVQVKRDDFVATVAAVLEETGIDSAQLELELTEGMLMQDTQAHIGLLDALAGLGVSLSVDDFGTGYSSLQYLKRFPLDTLKIDRCFVEDIEQDADDAAIVQATIGLAHSLRLKAVAEGVETAGQLEVLRALGCDEVQGFLFGRPLPLGDLHAWFDAQRDRDLRLAVA